jgi:hypothetical protein
MAAPTPLEARLVRDGFHAEDLIEMLVSARVRPFVALALLIAGAPGCNLALDIDRLNRGGEIEVLADGECSPGKIAVTEDHLFWSVTIPYDEMDNGCPQPARNAIRSLEIGPDGPLGSPFDVVSTNLDGDGDTTTDERPWQIAVQGQDLYWIGSGGAVCRADAGGSKQDCSPVPGLPAPCFGYGLRVEDDGFHLHGGDCALGGELRYFDAGVPALAPEGFPVAGGLVHEIDLYTPLPKWIAWVDGCPSGSGLRVNVGLPPAGASWSRCIAAGMKDPVPEIAIDEERLYWLETVEGKGSLWVLPLSEGLSPAPNATLVVRNINVPHVVVLDERHVYFTSQDRNGGVFFVPKDIPEASKTPDEIGALAENRDVPFDLTAEDEEWVYWLVSGTTHTVERARKPAK